MWRRESIWCGVSHAPISITVYLYLDGGFPAGTIRIVEINLLSGVGPGMFKVEKVDEGTVLQLEVYWPRYLVEPRTLNGKYLNRRSIG